MATLQKRKKSWRVQVRRKGGTVSATFDTKAEAEAWAITTESKIIEGIALEAIANEPAVPEAVTAAVTLKRYADEVSPNKRGGRWEQIRLRMLIRRYPLFQRPITSITGPDIADWRDARLIKVSASTVNRELCLISAVFTQAMKEWRLGLMANPCLLVTKPRKPRPRTQRVSVAERKKIIEQLGWDGKTEPESSSQWVAFAFYLALETAMRKGEILSLRWSDINFDARHAHLDMTKNGDERDVPLSKAAATLLRVVKKRKPAAPVVPVQRLICMKRVQLLSVTDAGSDSTAYADHSHDPCGQSGEHRGAGRLGLDGGARGLRHGPHQHRLQFNPAAARGKSRPVRAGRLATRLRSVLLHAPKPYALHD